MGLQSASVDVDTNPMPRPDVTPPRSRLSRLLPWMTGITVAGVCVLIKTLSPKAKTRLMHWVMDTVMIEGAPLHLFSVMATAVWIWKRDLPISVRVVLLLLLYRALWIRPPAFLVDACSRHYGALNYRFSDTSLVPIPALVGPSSAANLQLCRQKLPAEALYMIFPHGATFYAAGTVSSLLYRTWGKAARIVVAEAMLWGPTLNFGTRLVGIPTSASPSNILRLLAVPVGTARRSIVMYPGAMSDVFANCLQGSVANVSLPKVSSRVLAWAADNRWPVVPVFVLDEARRYWQPRVLRDVFRWISRNVVRVGLPCPPVFSNPEVPMRLLFGEPIMAANGRVLFDGLHRQVAALVARDLPLRLVSA
jgi:hypothetical protein